MKKNLSIIVHFAFFIKPPASEQITDVSAAAFLS